MDQSNREESGTDRSQKDIDFLHHKQLNDDENSTDLDSFTARVPRVRPADSDRQFQAQHEIRQTFGRRTRHDTYAPDTSATAVVLYSKCEVRYDLLANKLLHLATEYPTVKMFWENVAEKNNELIVLKKQ